MKEEVPTTTANERKAPKLKTIPWQDRVPITHDNAHVEAAKALQDIAAFLQSLSVTEGGRLRVTAYTRGGAIEAIRNAVAPHVGERDQRARTDAATKTIGERAKGREAKT